MRRLLLALGGLVVGVVLAGGVVWHSYTAGNGRPAARVTVPPGATLTQVVDGLHARELLASRRLMLLAARVSGRDRALQVGTFALPADASPQTILQILCEGAPVPVVVTLPEGLEAATMASVVADSLDLDALDILNVADRLVRNGADTLMTADARVRMEAAMALGSRADGEPLRWCEGYLAPDTYHLARGLAADQVAAAMVGLQLDRLRRTGVAAGDYHGLLSLAALVEAEARLPEERTRVAAVYRNRLARGMRLEADPTVAFWLGKRGQRLLYRDLDVDSPFNTYRRVGLPAGPVLAPGAAAIAAAAAPDTTCRALYFVADGAGGHVFSTTLAEHQRAVDRYRELMRQRRR